MATFSENAANIMLVAPARTAPEATPKLPLTALAESLAAVAPATTVCDAQETPRKPLTFQPRFVKVKGGVAHIVGYVGDVLLYVEAQTTGMAQSIKVWVLEKSKAVESAFQARAGPLTKRLSSALAAAKARSCAVVEPIYATVTDGVLRVGGQIRGTTLYFQAIASQTWVACNDRTSVIYAAACQRIDGFVRPIISSAALTLSSIRVKAFNVVEPSYVKTKDGALRVQTIFNGTVVYIKLGACERGNRVRMAALNAYTHILSMVGDYTKPVFAKAVSMYEALRATVMGILGPHLARVSDGCAYANTRIRGVAVAIKVRVLRACDRAADMSSFCVLTVKNGFVHIRGNVGDKMMYIKIRVDELLSHVKGVAAGLQQTATQRAVMLRDQTKGKLLALKDGVRDAASDQSVQATTAASVAGAVTVGGAGLVAGGVLGAAVGVPAAFFSFGLSIPLAAVIGSGAGLCAGVVTGGTVAGAAGHKIHQKRSDIAAGVQGTVAKVNDYKQRTADSAFHIRARLVGA